MGTYSLPVLALALNIAAFFYLQAWLPIVHLVRSIRLSRQIRAYRVAGLLLLVLAVNVVGSVTVYAKECTVKERQHVNCTPTCGFDKACVQRELRQQSDGIIVGVIRDQDYESARAIAKENGVDVSAWTYPEYSRGSDAVEQPHDWAHASETNFGRLPGLTTAQTYRMVMFVWNNCGKLMLVFGLLALASILNSKLKAQNECYGDVLRREAAERWEEETDDDSIHNPFHSPEGMQPTTQYVPVRSGDKY
jgi:hypothetical protein